MKADKKSRAEHIIQMTKRFNDGSRLVCSEIVSRWIFRYLLSLNF
jgi:son of sevenless-like protein